MNMHKKASRRKQSLVKRIKAAAAVFFHADTNLISLLGEELFKDDNTRYMVDFRPGRFAAMDAEADSSEDEDFRQKKSKTIKITVKPIDVLKELERMPTKYSLEGLDEKITMMKDKISMIGQNNTRNEAEVLLELLKNRKKYYKKADDGKIFWEYFAQFDTTHDGLIKKLLDKYELVMESADIFIPELPAAASETMSEFAKKFQELTERKPRFFVIATRDSFKKNYEKRDPILLVQSPFGFYYYILGAWDKEMLYLPEL